MIAPVQCAHKNHKKHGKDREGRQRYRCRDCGATFTDAEPTPLGNMRVAVCTAKLALRLLAEGNSVRSTERITGLHRDTICRLLVFFGTACRRFLDRVMQKLPVTHLEFDEQWSYVARKQSRLTVNEKSERHDVGDVYLFTCQDQVTKLLPSFLVGKRSADNARRFMMDVASRLDLPKPHEADGHAYRKGSYRKVVQISTDGFAGYPEAIDLAFGPYVRFGVIIKQFRNAKMVYTPSEMIGAKRRGIRGISGQEERSITTSHVERLNGTQRLFIKRLNRLTLCFSKKIENLEAAFALFAATYNFMWQTRRPGKSGAKRPTAAMMAKLTGHVWSFDELFDAVLA